MVVAKKEEVTRIYVIIMLHIENSQEGRDSQIGPVDEDYCHNLESRCLA